MVTQIQATHESSKGTTLVRKTKPKATHTNFQKVLDNTTSSTVNSTKSVNNTKNVSNVNNTNNSINTNNGKVDLDSIFEKAASTYNVPVKLLKAVAKAESNFKPNEVSSAGAIGVMQLMPGTAKELGVKDAYDPEQNIMGGAKYLSQKLKEYDGDVSLALAAYNAGSGNVKKYGGIPPFKETQNYVKKVLNYMGETIHAPQVDAGSRTNTGDINKEVNTVYQKSNSADLTLVQANSTIETQDAYERMKMSESYWRLMEQLISSNEEKEGVV